MWKTVLAFAAIASAPAIGRCADFWQVKVPEEWSEKEVAQMRTRSPWAKKEVQEKPGTERTSVTTGAGKNAKTTTKQTRVWAHVGEAQIRWESGAPLLAATARVDERLHKAMVVLAKEYYLVSVGGFVLPKGNDFAGWVNDVRAQSVLQIGNRMVGPHLVRAIDSGKETLYLLQFPRDLAFEEAGKGMELRVQIGETRVITRFEPKQMVFQGKPAL
jgi:hypothetical protein